MHSTKSNPNLDTKKVVSPRTEVEGAIFALWAAGGRIIPLKGNGTPAWITWNSSRALASGTAIEYHREHGPGSLGIQPSSVGLCHIDVDSSVEDARRLAASHRPLYEYLSRNGRGMHLAYAAPAEPMTERVGIAWDGARVDYKSSGMCRTPDEALLIIAGALVARADGAEVPELPDAFLEAYDAGKEELLRPATEPGPEPSGRGNAAPRSAPVGGRGRGTPLACQPAPATRIEDALIGQRNTTLFIRTLTKMGPRARHFTSYVAYEDHFLPISLAAAHRMAVPEETDQQIIATIRSALGTAWRNRHGAVPISDGRSSEERIKDHRRQSQLGGEVTARLKQAQCAERYTRILEIDETTRTVAETAAAAGVSESTVYRARRDTRGTKTPTTVTTIPPMPYRRVTGSRIFRTPPRGRPRAVSPKKERMIWRASDGGMGLRRLSSEFRLPRSTVQGIVARKPRGQGECDRSIRGLARALLKRHGKPHLAGIAKAVAKRHGVKLPTAVVREWLELEPGPDYTREQEARAAARAARKPRVPVPPEVKELRRTLRLIPGSSLTLIEVSHPKVPQAVLESEHRRALRGWLRGGWQRAA